MFCGVFLLVFFYSFSMVFLMFLKGFKVVFLWVSWVSRDFGAFLKGICFILGLTYCTFWEIVFCIFLGFLEGKS